MRTFLVRFALRAISLYVGMKPLSERDENLGNRANDGFSTIIVGMKPLSERDEN